MSEGLKGVRAETGRKRSRSRWEEQLVTRGNATTTRKFGRLRLNTRIAANNAISRTKEALVIKRPVGEKVVNVFFVQEVSPLANSMLEVSESSSSPLVISNREEST